MRLVIKIKIDFESKKQAKIFFDSVKPELKDNFNRSNLKIAQNNNILKVEISALDKSAARASLNSIIKPLKLFKELNELN